MTVLIPLPRNNMADAPSGGGGISGGEILVLVVLAIGAITVFSGHPLQPVQPTPTTTTSSTKQQCTITLSRPVSKETISRIATVAGSITPCTSTAPLSTTVNVQVVDSTGALMSAYTPVSVVTTNPALGTFAATIPITGTPAAGTGYLIVTGPNNPDGTTSTARVAIHFATQ